MLKDYVADLSSKGICVIEPKDMVSFFGSREKIYTYLNRMKNKGILKKIMRGKYALCNDAFAVSSQIFKNSYLSLTTALFLHNSVDQLVDNIFVVFPGRRRDLKVLGSKTQFIHFSPDRIFGYKKIGNTQRFVADLEKTVVDILYVPRYARISYAYDVLNKCDVKKLRDYALRMRSESVIRRLGFILDLSGIKHDLHPTGKQAVMLNPSIKRKGKFNSKWRLYVNEVLK